MTDSHLFRPIEAGANATHTTVAVPCNTAATLCVRRGAAAEAAGGLTLLLDGSAVARPTVESHHICVENVGCGAGGVARVVTLAPTTDTHSGIGLFDPAAPSKM